MDQDVSPLKRKALDIGDFSIDTSSSMKVKRNDSTRLELYCNYKKASGRWSKKQMTVNKSNYDTVDEVNDAIMKMTSRLEQFYQDNHVQDDEDEDGEPAADAED